MQPNHSSRVTLILAILIGSIFAISPPTRWFNSSIPLSQKHNLKPGIDMVGGTSLLYEIKPPEGQFVETNLAEQVMESLKKRVDPDGVRNLIWRPQGNTRLEIQMPTSGASNETAQLRKDYADAQRALEATNIRLGEVLAAVETKTGDARRDRLKQLEVGSETRAKIFGAMASVFDQIKQSRQDGKVEAEAAGLDEYDALKTKVDKTNLSVNELESILSMNDATKRAEKLKEAEAAAEGFDQRKSAIARFESTFAAYSKVKGVIDDASELKRLLKGSGVLEFHILVTDFSSPIVQSMSRRLHEKGPVLQAGDQTRWYEIDRPDEFRQPTEIYNEKHWALAWIVPDKQMVNGSGIERWALERAYPTRGEFGNQLVGFRFDLQGAQYFSTLTGRNINQPLAIMLDDKIISAPNIRSQIGREGTIDGGEKGYTQLELLYLVNTLNAGSLPAKLAEEPISERTVGPQLGQDNLQKGFLGCVLGVVIVALFLIVYYHLSGVIAMLALLMNVIIILGVLAAFNATFTLPALAGLVLTLGAAVDANVLIFERFREEQHRGLNVKLALHNAYDRAFSAIVDSNATTLVTSLILYWLGSEEVKGFGLTLLIGLISSLFTSLYVTRTIFDILIDKFGLNKLGSLPKSIPAWDRLLKPDIDWMKVAPWFASFSALVVVVGITYFGIQYKKGKMLDIEFASGTSVQFEVKEKTPIDVVRKLIENADRNVLPAPSVYSVNSDDKTYEVATANPDSVAVREAVLHVMGDRLKIDLPSTFQYSGRPAEAVANLAIFPVTAPNQQVAGFSPERLPSYLQGGAIVLNQLSPPLKPSEIRERIERQRLQPQASGAPMPYRDFTVESPLPGDQPTTTAVVLLADPDLPYEKDGDKWRQELVGPMWKLVNEAVNNEARLQKVTNFDAQVAGDTSRDALGALILSVLVIMAYIWLRFGNLRYGTATVLAMVHDTLLVIGAIGLSHLLSDTAIGNLLLVEPFRINLTMVAAILTVMSYSMIDTIVVFDRVRENRGKYGHLSRKMVNDSINQTLGRTLLTVGTTLMTVTGMYIFGGAGIHGFTFVLVIGILVGSYSSIAVACPILLVGAKKDKPVTKNTPAGTLPQAAG